MTPYSDKSKQGGFALFATLIIIIIVGIIAVSSLRTTELTEALAGNSIQRSRAMQGAEGGLIEAERDASSTAKKRIFASSVASDGFFIKDSVTSKWWRTPDFKGAKSVDNSRYPGVSTAPVYVVEEIGTYESDGGNGIVNLDRGGQGYGRLSAEGRQLVLYRMQSRGVGSTPDAQAIVESLFIQSQ